MVLPSSILELLVTEWSFIGSMGKILGEPQI